MADFQSSFSEYAMKNMLALTLTHTRDMGQEEEQGEEEEEQ